MSKKERLLRKTARYVWYPLAWVIVLVYMTFETLWSVVSDWVFTYTPLQVFSERIHQHLVGRSVWLVLLVYLAHFALMQVMAFLSGKMFLQGNIWFGGMFYICKGLVTIPTVRFFMQEKDKLLTFWLIRIGYLLVVFIKSSGPYHRVVIWATALKERIKRLSAKFTSNSNNKNLD